MITSAFQKSGQGCSAGKDASNEINRSARVLDNDNVLEGIDLTLAGETVCALFCPTVAW